MAADILDRYFDYLIKEYRLPENYTILMKQLFDTPFIAINIRDEARIDDGLELREWFPYYAVILRKKIEFPCSCLEVLLSLSIRMDNEIVGTLGEVHVNDIFMELLENLNLLEFDNINYDEEEVEEIVSVWINREYESDGKGSIFPIPNKRDIINKSLWNQMLEYVYYNY